MRIAACSALLIAAPAAAQSFAGATVSAGVAWHDQFPGRDPFASVRLHAGAHLFDHVSVVAVGQFAWTREESNDEEFPGAWPVWLATLGAGLQFDAGPFALQLGVGPAIKHLPWGTNEGSAAVFSSASMQLWRWLRFDLCGTRWILGDLYNQSATTVSAGLGAAF